jgi:hypothetical protein
MIHEKFGINSFLRSQKVKYLKCYLKCCAKGKGTDMINCIVNNSVLLKFILRKPLLMTLLVGSIALISFMFSSRAFEGVIVDREIRRIESGYHAVGRVVPNAPLEWSIEEVELLLQESSYVSYTDNLRVIQGVMEDIFTPDIGGFTPFVNSMFVYGTLIEKEHFSAENHFAGEFPENYYMLFPMLPYMDLYVFTVVVDEVVASMPEFVSEGEELRFALIDYRQEKYHVYVQAEIGQRYLMSGQFSLNLTRMETEVEESGIPGRADIPGMEAVLPSITRLPRISGTDPMITRRHTLILQPLNPAEDIFLYPVGEQGQVEDGLVLERTSEEIEVLHNNIHTIFLRPTKDLTMNPITSPIGLTSVYLLEGRFIDSMDNIEENPVAVIRGEFANIRGLTIGDTLTVTMRESPFAVEYIVPDSLSTFPVRTVGTRSSLEGMERGDGLSPFVDAIYYEGVWFPIHRWIGVLYEDVSDEIINLEMATGYITDRETRYNRSRSDSLHNWRDMETQEINLEIVGIYGVNDEAMAFQSFLYNNVFVPDTIVPINWTQDTLYRNFSFVLNSPDYEEDFLLRYEPLLYELGFTPFFLESGVESFRASVSPIRAGIITNVFAFALLAIIVFYLIVWVYFVKSRKDYAIMRALGAKKMKGAQTIFGPIFLIGLVGILIGSIPSWFLALQRAERTVVEIDEVFLGVNNNISVMLFLAIVIPMLLIFCLLILFKIRGLMKYSELELLQGDSKKVKRRKKAH